MLAPGSVQTIASTAVRRQPHARAAPGALRERPHVARVYDYLLGGKDNFAADREAAEQAMRINPAVVPTAHANRAFLARATRYLTAGAGLRQFLDIGTGMPAGSNIHEVAQSAAPESRVVYVDHDPIVLSHARALLISGPEGRTDFIEADQRQPLATLTEAARTLDSGRPVAVILTAILHLIQDAEGPHQLVRQLVGALAPGSAVMIRRRHQAVAPALGVPLGRR